MSRRGVPRRCDDGSVVRGDGNGWTIGAGGARHWGRFGAAGLLVRAPAADEGGPGASEAVVLLQHRAVWSHEGGTWSIPGGARDSHESAVDAALREAAEEAGLDPAALIVRAEIVTLRSGSWSYTTVVADAAEPHVPTLNAESEELAWIAESAVESLPLHRGFAAAWPTLRATVVHAGPPGTSLLPDGDFTWRGEQRRIECRSEASRQ